jgi:catechol 2,3-dioxygenase-like lactoylglutathione lyase family enzyme
MKPRGLRHLALTTTDLEKSARFYIDVLGLERAFSHPGMIFLRTPGGDDLLNFVESKAPVDPKASGLDHFGLHFTRPQWKRVAPALERAGVSVRGRRGRSAVYIEDPNGYTVELYVD